MKRCSKCGESKPVDQFYAAKGTRDGLRGECKACFAARAARRYEAKKDHIKAQVKRWQQENAEHLRAYRKVYRQEKKPQEREAYLRRKFGIGLDDYTAMLEAQGGGCAVCGRPEPEGGSLHVDHDHETGAVRGLLCFRCNGAIGNLDEDAERLADAIVYLHAARSDDVDPHVAQVRARAAALVRNP